MNPAAAGVAPHRRVLDVFLAFLRLGLSAFGGPVAHLAHFHREFVERRRWLDEGAYADLVALCQFLPGPSSSQVGLALGLGRAGWAGGFAAWCGFTLPSALLLILLAHALGAVPGLTASGAVHGVKVVAVAVVAQALWAMGRALCPDRLRIGLAILTAILALSLPCAVGQIVAIVLAGIVGRLWLKPAPATGTGRLGGVVSQRRGLVALGVFAILLVGLPVVARLSGSTSWAIVDGVYRAGALIFGGGHVMLPLLEASVVPLGVIDPAVFLAGYGATQAMPGPLSTFAAFVGAAMTGPLSGWSGGLILLILIFLPSFLLVIGVLPFWELLRSRADIRSALAGINAGVVGLLLAAFYDPIWAQTIHGRADVGLALAAFGLLTVGRLAPPWVVLAGAFAGLTMA